METIFDCLGGGGFEEKIARVLTFGVNNEEVGFGFSLSCDF